MSLRGAAGDERWTRRGNLVAMHKYIAGSLCFRRNCRATLAM